MPQILGVGSEFAHDAPELSAFSRPRTAPASRYYVTGTRSEIPRNGFADLLLALGSCSARAKRSWSSACPACRNRIAGRAFGEALLHGMELATLLEALDVVIFAPSACTASK